MINVKQKTSDMSFREQALLDLFEEITYAPITMPSTKKMLWMTKIQT
jgi:hypothetical protein